MSKTQDRSWIDEELDSVLIGMYMRNSDGDFVPLDDSKNVLRVEAKSIIKQKINEEFEALLKSLPEDVDNTSVFSGHEINRVLSEIRSLIKNHIKEDI